MKLNDKISGIDLDIVVTGFPGKSVCHGGLGWSTVVVLRAHGRIAVVDTGGFSMRTMLLKRFAERGLPIIGDDIKSQVGATITHRVLTTLFRERGVRLDHTYQLNFGGNMDFYNMLERERLESKKISKTGAVTSLLPYPLPAEDVHVGPSDYVPWLTDRKDRKSTV